MRKLLLFSLILFLGWSCSEDIQNPSLSITPSDYLQIADTGQIVHFSITAGAYKKNSLKVFRISYMTNIQVSKIIVDSNLNDRSKFNYEFDFKVPAFKDTTDVTITFYVEDNEGNNMQLSRILKVETYSESSISLTEISGNTIYSDPNFHGTAFNLLNCQVLNRYTAADSLMHILADTNVIGATLPLKWLSPANLKFVRFNGFDYANATQESAKASYDAGAKNDFISNIVENDIILTRIVLNNVPKYVVIRIMNIYDDVGTDNDRIVFNVKK